MYTSSTSTDVSYDEGSYNSPTTPPSDSPDLRISVAPYSGGSDSAPTPPPKDSYPIYLAQPCTDELRHVDSRLSDSTKRGDPPYLNGIIRQDSLPKPSTGGGFLKTMKNKLSRKNLRTPESPNRNGSTSIIPPLPTMSTTSLHPYDVRSGSIPYTESVFEGSIIGSTNGSVRTVTHKRSRFGLKKPGSQQDKLSLNRMNQIPLDLIVRPTDGFARDDVSETPSSPVDEGFGFSRQRLGSGGVDFQNPWPLKYPEGPLDTSDGSQIATNESQTRSFGSVGSTTPGRGLSTSVDNPASWSVPDSWAVVTKEKQPETEGDEHASDTESELRHPPTEGQFAIPPVQDLDPRALSPTVAESIGKGKHWSFRIYLEDTNTFVVVHAPLQRSVHDIERDLYGKFGMKSRDEQFRTQETSKMKLSSSGTFLTTGSNASRVDFTPLLPHPEVLENVGEKDYEPHRLYLQERNRARLLDKKEKPAAIVKRRLLQAGYTEEDNLEEIGKDDLIFLLKFAFRTTRLGQSKSLSQSISSHDTHPSDPVFKYSNFAGDMQPEDFQKDFQRYRSIMTENQDGDKQVDSITRELNGKRFSVNCVGRSYTAIPTICHQFAQFIEVLNLSMNALLEIPVDFAQQCESLKDIILCNMTIKKVPQGLREIKSLQSIDLSSNRIMELEGVGLETLPHLQVLKLQNNRLERLPGLYHLRNLNISNNKFEEIPEVVCSMPRLEVLDVSFNSITRLPTGLHRLKELHNLIIAGNRISSFPLEFARLQKLSRLDCRRNNITDLSILCKLPSLTKVYAENNAISSLDLSFGPAFSLIELAHNDITKVILSPSRTSALTTLHLCHAKLAVLDALDFTLLTSLQFLKLDYNMLKELPASICSLASLRTLSCSDNELQTIPENIGLLSNLRTLDLHNNAIEEVPASIWKCCSLVKINLTSNFVRIWHNPPPRNELEESLDRKNSATTITGAAMELSSSPPLARILRELYLGDNQLDDDIFHPLKFLKQLTVINLSFNKILDIPPFWVRSLLHVERLYLSGNRLTSLPAEDLHKLKHLTELFLNGNKLHSLPRQLSDLENLTVIDVGSNVLKYNINNVQYDWNWNSNPKLRYINLSGNTNLEVVQGQLPKKKQQRWNRLPEETQEPTEFSNLPDLKLIDLTGVKKSELFRDETAAARRIRVMKEPIVNGMAIGLADSLHTGTALGVFDIIKGNFRGNSHESLFGVVGSMKPVEGTQLIASFIVAMFPGIFKHELGKLKHGGDVPDALRRAFLFTNSKLYDFAFSKKDSRKDSLSASPAGSGNNQNLHKIGAEGAIVYIDSKAKRLYAANVGKAQVVISRRGKSHLLSMDHDPFERSEAERIRQAEGWVSPQRKVNDETEMDVSRSFGYFNIIPAVNAAPYVGNWVLSDKDEFVILASRGLWDFIPYQTAVDIVRSHFMVSDDPMVAAQILRDFAMSYGASGSTMIFVLHVGGLFGVKEINEDDTDGPRSKKAQLYDRRKKEGDPGVARLEPEIEPPKGYVTLVFTDIRNSTFLWEKMNDAMAAAMRIHHQLLRRLLRMSGGYEVKTEGDAFMVSFNDASSALHWCFQVQLELLNMTWPKEILESDEGKEVFDSQGRTIARGLSVRMGVHSGEPYCERDPVTRRMDYYGPIVNRSARVCHVAGGGQIMCSRSVVREIEEGLAEGSDDPVIKDIRERRPVFHPMGVTPMKGLDEPEVLQIILPEELSGRLELPEATPFPTLAFPVSPPMDPADPESPSTAATTEETSDDESIILIEEEPSSGSEPDTKIPRIVLPSFPWENRAERFLDISPRILDTFNLEPEPNTPTYSLEDQVQKFGELSLRLEALTTKRVIRLSRQATPQDPSSPIMMHADPSLFLPRLSNRSEAELTLLLDSFSVRIHNALLALNTS